MSDDFESNNNQWKDAPLSELVDCLDGVRRPIKKEDRVNITGQYPYYGASGIIDYVNDFLFDEDLILLGEDGENVVSRNLPLAFKITGKNWVNNHAHVLRPKQNQNIDFLVYKLENRDYTDIISGSAQPKINQQNLMKLIFKVPNDINEQRRIARILTTCDAVIEKTRAAIAKYKAIKQGMLHDLFTRGIDLQTGKLRPKYEGAPELYKKSKLGWIPREWEVERLEDLTEKIGSGITPTGGSEIYRTSGVLFIRSQNVLIGRLSIKDAAFITDEIDEMMHASKVRPFDVLLNITGASIGRCAFFPEELNSANVNQHVCIIRFYKMSKELAVFASEFLNSDFGQSQINRLNAGGNREGLNFQQIKSFSFPVIEDNELKSISKKIETIQNKLQSEQNYLQKLQAIKKGLMGDLLSGKKRLNLD